MARKRKTRKYIPRNEFRRNVSLSANAHYNYVFGETKTHYKSLGLTTNPRNDIPYYELSQNPNPKPKNSKPSCLQLKVLSTNKKYLLKAEKGWKFAREDMPVVRHTIKKYKKSTNRKSKLWYEKKRKWNKKNR